VARATEYPLPIDDELASSQLGKIMVSCLNFDPMKRPSMSDIYLELEEMYNTTS